ncbi:unnamed protein product, partial [Laminaria digitata]
VVLARGLGVRRLLAKFLVLHCMHGDTLAPSLGLKKEVGGKGGSDRERSGTSEESSAEFSETRSGQRSEGDNETKRNINTNTDTSTIKRRRTSTSKSTATTAATTTTTTTATTAAAAAAARLNKSRPLVLCLNTKGEENLFMDALMADGVPPDRLPEVVDAECTPVQREGMYRSGGVFLVSSRVLIVDLLNKTVSPERISGFLVHNAHRVVETSSEAFILRCSTKTCWFSELGVAVHHAREERSRRKTNVSWKQRPTTTKNNKINPKIIGKKTKKNRDLIEKQSK